MVPVSTTFNSKWTLRIDTKFNSSGNLCCVVRLEKASWFEVFLGSRPITVLKGLVCWIVFLNSSPRKLFGKLSNLLAQLGGIPTMWIIDARLPEFPACVNLGLTSHCFRKLPSYYQCFIKPGCWTKVDTKSYTVDRQDSSSRYATPIFLYIEFFV